MDRDVVDTVIHYVNSDGRVPVEREGDFQFGSHAVHARHQHSVARESSEGEKAPKRPELSQHTRAESLASESFDSGFGAACGIDIDARISVAHATFATDARSLLSFRAPGQEDSLGNFVGNPPPCAVGHGYSPAEGEMNQADQKIFPVLDQRVLLKKFPMMERSNFRRVISSPSVHSLLGAS